MVKNTLKRTLPAIFVLCLLFCLLSPVIASNIPEGSSLGLQQQPTTAPTLPVELYSQTATPGLDGGIRHTVLEGQFLITIAEMFGEYWLICQDCGRKYPIWDGILIMRIDEGDKWRATEKEDLPVPPPMPV